MKIAFLQKYPFAYTGVISLSSSLPEEYQREVFIGDLERNVVAEVIRYKPDVLGLSMMSTEYVWMKEAVSKIKQYLPEVIVVAGGVHPTICPEIVKEEHIDAVCVGEGEYSFPSFLTRLGAEGRLEAVDGFWVKQGKRVIKNREPGLVLSLDELPDEDRSVYYKKYTELRNERLKHFIASRGCPFACSFCCHQVWRELYRGKGKYVRWKKPEKFIREIVRIKEQYPLSSVYFLDDLFVLDLEWLKRFSALYRELIGLPYYVTVTAPMMTNEIALLFKESGCHTVTFGIETGDEAKRRTILNKPVSDEAILKCARLIKKHGMKIQTTNMFGLPFETVEEAFDTIQFNIRVGTDYLCSNMLIPFPETGIEKMAFELGILDKKYLLSRAFRGTHLSSVFNFKDIRIIENVQKIAHLALKFPSLIPFFKKLVRVRSKKLFFGLFVISVMWRYKSENAISWIEVMKLFWRHRKNYL